MTAEQAEARTVAFRTLGCKVNRVESETAAAALLDRGWTVTAPDRAAVVVVNTCTVTGEADAKARKEIRRALAAPGSPLVVVTGCLAALDPEGVAGLGERVVVLTDCDRLAAEIDLLRLGGRPGGSSHIAARPSATHEAFRTRAMVKVQDGCDAFCAYCVVPHARGMPRSRPSAEVVDEIRGLAADGVQEVVLTGINVGRYEDDGLDLAGLVSRAAAVGPRLRLSSVEPLLLTPVLLAAMGDALAEGRFCPHLHIPLQSASETVLARMGRGYGAAGFVAAVDGARKALGPVALTTDVISGLPGETDADARATESFVRSLGFQRLHVFRYSPRSGTPAAEMPDQVAPSVRRERAAVLRSISDDLLGAYQRARVGDVVRVVLEGPDRGTAEDHLRVVLEAPVAPGAEPVAVKILGVEGAYVTGRAEG